MVRPRDCCGAHPRAGACQGIHVTARVRTWPTYRPAAGSLAAGAGGEARDAQRFLPSWARARRAGVMQLLCSLPRASGQEPCWGRGAHPRARRGPSDGLIWGCGALLGQHSQPRHPLCGHAGPTAQTTEDRTVPTLSPPYHPGPVSAPHPAARSDPGVAQAGVGRPRGSVPGLEPLAQDMVGKHCSRHGGFQTGPWGLSEETLEGA